MATTRVFISSRIKKGESRGYKMSRYKTMWMCVYLHRINKRQFGMTDLFFFFHLFFSASAGPGKIAAQAYMQA
jgi:hypothetical protein